MVDRSGLESIILERFTDFAACVRRANLRQNSELRNFWRLRSLPTFYAFGVYAGKLLARDRLAEFESVLEFVEEVHEHGTSEAIDNIVFFVLEALAGTMEELGIDFQLAESRLGQKSSESVELLILTNLWYHIPLLDGSLESVAFEEA